MFIHTSRHVDLIMVTIDVEGDQDGHGAISTTLRLNPEDAQQLASQLNAELFDKDHDSHEMFDALDDYRDEHSPF